jgi:hypothetical protein
MTEDIKAYQDTSDPENTELSLKALFLSIHAWIAYLRSRWIKISIITVCGLLLGFLYTQYKKLTYTADSTFVLSEGGASSGLSQYAGLASIIGIDIGSSGNGIFQGDNIIELYRSYTMLRKTLLSDYADAGKKELLIERYVRYNKLRDKWEENRTLKHIHFVPDRKGKYSRVQDSVIKTIVRAINKENLDVGKPDKKLSIIRVRILSPDEVFAKNFNDKLVANVNEFYVQTRLDKSIENIRILKHQTDSVRAILNGAIYSSVGTLDATPNLNPTRQILRAPVERSRLNAEANKALLSELIRNLELANISMRRDMPLIKMVDQPVYPLDNDRRSLPRTVLLGGFLFFFLGVALLTAWRIYKQIMNGN